MKRILLSLVMVIGAVAMVAGATQALFSDSDSVDGNTVSTVSLSIDAREVVNKPLSDLLLLPGEWGDPGTVDLYNDGNSPQRQWMYVQNIQGDLCQYVQLKVGYSYEDPNVFNVVFDTYQLSDLEGSENARNVGRSDPVGGNITTRLVQQPYVDTDAPNSVQSSTCTWDEVFVATQPGEEIEQPE